MLNPEQKWVANLLGFNKECNILFQENHISDLSKQRKYEKIFLSFLIGNYKKLKINPT